MAFKFPIRKGCILPHVSIKEELSWRRCSINVSDCITTTQNAPLLKHNTPVIATHVRQVVMATTGVRCSVCVCCNCKNKSKTA